MHEKDGVQDDQCIQEEDQHDVKEAGRDELTQQEDSAIDYDYEKFHISTLKDLCKLRGLNGSKSPKTLIARLKAQDRLDSSEFVRVARGEINEIEKIFEKDQAIKNFFEKHHSIEKLVKSWCVSKKIQVVSPIS